MTAPVTESQYIARLMAAAPPLSEGQFSRLDALLRTTR